MDYFLLPVSRAMIAWLFSCITVAVPLYAANCKKSIPQEFLKIYFLPFGKITLYAKFHCSMSKNKKQYIEQEYDSMTRETDSFTHIKVISEAIKDETQIRGVCTPIEVSQGITNSLPATLLSLYVMQLYRM